MSIINFSITKPLETKVKKIIKDQGFTSKAEFFRFTAMKYIDSLQGDISQADYEASVQALKHTVRKKYGSKKLASLEEQLADLN